MQNLSRILIIIPSLDPDEKLFQVVQSLREVGFEDILLVDDGSVEEKKHYFNKLEQEENCKLLVHEVNKGKGVALKTAFAYAIDNAEKYDGVVTVDGDNQHKADDVLTVANLLIESRDSIVLGVRNFDNNANIPLRSKVGNKTTAFIFGIITGSKINDTQTGLRGLRLEALPSVAEIEGERFEYEMNMLINLKRLHLKVIQTPIQTIYIENNETSHFNPIVDSVKVLNVVFKFLCSSMLSTAIDMGIFSLIVYVLFKGNDDVEHVFIATCSARVVSSIVNFLLNSKVVFRSDIPMKRTIVKYYMLAIVQMFLSSTFTTIVSQLFTPAVAKAFVDIVLFVISFKIQNKWIFNNKSENQNKESISSD